ncbi:YceI family protein [Enterovibrio nigricans]|uniref:Polyisoprenoid-binding protein YceI n=1 Tax=Enterovibrio nigricans DSM 22720 TaxID=1121868 RepID=A0A1T4UIM6_9GAMM|nr:YceI family protein [Enterovibrio nigricans]PKF50419.1 YceI family protein [Enterovibrio nigricans]SKA52321.1 Polyisoprenoid-binding protein YceI [Enterovibrio nigricans DSM 22720]
MKSISSAIILAVSLSPSLTFASSDYTVVSDASSISFATIKKTYVVEPANLSGLEGSVDASGKFSITAPISSVSTGIPIRNQRLNDLFFDSKKFPSLKVEGHVDMAGLDKNGTMLQQSIPAKVTLFGNTKDITLDMNIIKTDDSIFAFTYKPVIISGAIFGIPEENLEKVSATVGNIDISSTVPVSVSLVFKEK